MTHEAVMPDQPHKEPWHLDRRIPLALILTILIQTGAAVWWAAKVDSQLTAGKERMDKIERREDASNQLLERVTRLEVVMDRLDKTLDKLERRLDRSPERGG